MGKIRILKMINTTEKVIRISEAALFAAKVITIALSVKGIIDLVNDMR